VLAAMVRSRALQTGGALLMMSGTALAEDGSINLGDAGQAVATLLIFGVLLLILGRYAWKPVVAQLRRREEAIASLIERAEKREQESREMLEHYRGKLESVEGEARAVLAQARQEAVEARETIMQAAQEEAKRSAQAAREEIEYAKRSALRELREVTAEMTVDLSARVLGRTLNPQDQSRLIEESLAEIRQHEHGKP